MEGSGSVSEHAQPIQQALRFVTHCVSVEAVSMQIAGVLAQRQLREVDLDAIGVRAH